MKLFNGKVLIIFLITGVMACKTADDPFKELSQLEGNWVMRFEGGSAVVETWKKINDTLYTGKSFEVTEGDSMLTENLQLVRRNGEIYYIPTVENQNDRQPVAFKLTRHEGNIFTFENPQHDFPTTITYEFKGADSINATISGTIKGELRSMEFEYGKN